MPAASHHLDSAAAASGFIKHQGAVLREIAFERAEIGEATVATVVERMRALSFGLEYRRMTAIDVYTDPCLAEAVAAWATALSRARATVDGAIEATEAGDAQAPTQLNSTDLPALEPTFQAAVNLAREARADCG